MKSASTNNIIGTLICAILTVCMLGSCKSTKSPSTPNAVITKTEEVFFNSIIDKSFQFKTLSARLKFEYLSPQKELSSRAQLKMIYNELIQISIQPILGIEMFRIELTADSIKFIDRMNKCYVTDSYNNIKDETETLTEFNFNNLQSLITNRIFVPNKSDLSPKEYRRFKMDKTDNYAELKLKDATGMLYTFLADSDEKLVSTSISDNSDENKIIWKYNNFQDIDGQTFPLKMIANLFSREKEKASVILTFSTPEINNYLTTTFNIPSGYKKITLSKIIKSLENK